MPPEWVTLNGGVILDAEGRVGESAIFAATVNNRLFIGYEFTDYTFKSEAEEAVNVVEAVIEPRPNRDIVLHN